MTRIQYKQVDVLLYNDDPVSLSIRRVLSKYPDVTLFSQKDIGPIIPDLIIFTKTDIYAAIKDFRVVETTYPGVNVAYVRSKVDSVALGAAFINGIDNFISCDATGREMYKFVHEAAVTVKPSFTTKYRTKFLNKRYSHMLRGGISFKEACILGAKLRGYSDAAMCRIFKTSLFNINIICNSAYKILGLSRYDRRSVANILKYGGVVEEPKASRHVIPKTRRYTPTYFLIPKFDEEIKN